MPAIPPTTSGRSPSKAGIPTHSAKGRLEALEARKKELEIRITGEKLANPKISGGFVRFWLTRFRKPNPQIKSHRKPWSTFL